MLMMFVYRNGAQVGRFWFQTVPRVGEEIRLPGNAVYTVQRVRHTAGDPSDNNPPAFAELLVI